MGDYTRYLQALIDDRRAHPREDLLSDLIHGANGYPGLPDDYTQCIVRGAARVAGFDTTRDSITSTMLAVLQDPSIRERVLADPVKTIPKATEVPAGSGVPPQLGAAGGDPEQAPVGGVAAQDLRRCCCCSAPGTGTSRCFPNPDAVDLDRPNVREHLAFGRGLHVCPGAPMARGEIRVALEHLMNRRPGLRLADGYEPLYIASYFFRGLESLDVTW